jgi:DNA/RNA-binding domain of Phe-tRNA-synthetase-like protein
MQLSIAEIAPRFPDFRVAAIVAENLQITGARAPSLDALIAEREAACRAAWAGLELADIPGIAVWREAYKGFGIKRTSYRSSVERLVKRVMAGERLPVVNTFVDLYNAVSLSHVMCCGADDLDKVEPPLAFRFSRPGDSFIDMGAPEGTDPNDPPKEGEVVYADTRHVLCRRWNWRQDARTGISPRTTRAVVTIQANGAGDLDAAVEDFVALATAHCGARSEAGIASATKPTLEF